MTETQEKINLFIKRDEIGRKIINIIEERGLKEDSEIEALDEHKEFMKITEELKNKF